MLSLSGRTAKLCSGPSRRELPRRRLVTLLATTAFFFVAGCDQRSQKGVAEVFGTAMQEAAFDDIKKRSRAEIDREVTPLVVASVLGEFAPGGGPAVLNGLLADAMWDDRLQMVAAESELLQDVFPRSPLKPGIIRKK